MHATRVPTGDMMTDAILLLDSEDMHVYLGVDAVGQYALRRWAETGKPYFMLGIHN